MKVKLNRFFTADGGDGGAGGAAGGAGAAGGQQQQQKVLGGDPNKGGLGGFLDSITDESLRNDPAFMPLRGKSVDEAAKQFQNLSKLVGKKTVEMPSEDWTDDQWNAFYAKFPGVPEKPEDYGLNAPENAPEGAEWDKDFAANFTKTAKEIGLTKRQVAKLAELHNGKVLADLQARQSSAEQQTTQWIDSLKKDFGSDFDTKVNDARLAIRSFGGKELAATLAQYGLDSHPVLVKAFAAAGSVLREDVAAGRVNSGGFTASAESARAEIAKLEADEKFMADYMDPSKPGHKAAVERRTRLFRQANGE